jgi:hypothetical protein
MADGWEKITYKAPENGPVVPVAASPASAKKWVKIAEFHDLALGKTHLSMELGGVKGGTITDIKTEWVKAGGTDPSKRHGHEIGKESGWASAPGAQLEDIQAADLPISLWIWQNGGTLSLTKIITAAHNPKAEIAADLG